MAALACYAGDAADEGRVSVPAESSMPRMTRPAGLQSPELAMDRWMRATLNTWNGLIAATRSEAALREELVALALSVPLAFMITTDAWKRLALIGAVLLLIVVELLNTAIEKLADHVTPALHPGIGRIKDMGSAAVGVALLVAAATWLVAVGEHFGLL
jgi:diacylglycerol kinase (ATP)